MDLRSRLNPQQLQSASDICRAVEELMELRPHYVRERGLDPEIANPAANWSTEADNDIHKLFELVSRREPEVLGRLRLYTQPFTGYPMALDAEGGPEAAARIQTYARRFEEMTRELPRRFVCPMPDALGEVGQPVGGGRANHDACAYQERVSLLYEAGVLNWLRSKRSPRVVEIGGGFGALAFHLKRIIPRLEYVIVDLPESLLFSALYLKLTRPDVPHEFYRGRLGPGFNFVANFMFDELKPPFDLAVNTLSLSEMTEAQARHYAEGLRKLLCDKGIFLEQNQDNSHLSWLNVKDFLPEYFPHGETIRAASEVTQGRADLWATRDVREIVGRSYLPARGPFRRAVSHYRRAGLAGVLTAAWNSAADRLSNRTGASSARRNR